MPTSSAATEGGRLDGFHRRHAGFHHELKFEGVLAVQRNPRVGAESNLDAGFVGLGESALDLRAHGQGFGTTTGA
jgi:hypothetical protein